MTADEKARKLAVPSYKQIHEDIGGILSMGDIACIVGQRMHEMLMEMHEWTKAEFAAVAGGNRQEPQK